MNSMPRQQLREAVTRYGRTLSNNPRLCEALLNDLCGEYKGEIGVLVAAARAGVVTDLLTSGSSAPRELLLKKHVRHLEDFHYTESAARWGVESWALALGLMADDELSPWPPAKGRADPPTHVPGPPPPAAAPRPVARVRRNPGRPISVYISSAVAALMLITAVTTLVLKNKADRIASEAFAAKERAEQSARASGAAKEKTEQDSRKRIEAAMMAKEAAEKNLKRLSQAQPRAEVADLRAEVVDYGATIHAAVTVSNLQSVQCVLVASVLDEYGNEVKSSSRSFMPTKADVSYADIQLPISSSYGYLYDGEFTYKVVVKRLSGELITESEEKPLID